MQINFYLFRMINPQLGTVKSGVANDMPIHSTIFLFLYTELIACLSSFLSSFFFKKKNYRLVLIAMTSAKFSFNSHSSF